jgi:tetratricopeptide (TPR) repeat protein
VDATKLREFLKKLVGQKYQAEDLGAVDLRDPDNLDQPFRLSFEALKAGMAITSTREAMVTMNPWPLVDAFHSIMFATPSDRPAGSADDSAPTKVPERERPEDARRTDLLIHEPQVKEARWVFRAPPGYANESLPENRIVTFGSATLRSTYSRQGDGTVEALFRFECAQRRWTPQQVMEARKALRLFGAEKKPAIHFQNTGEAHLSAGRIQEALAAFQLAVQEQPKAAAPLLRMARAQLAGGLGDSARRSALRAIDLEPASSLAQGTLAWILQHDQAGRRAKDGWQRKEAIAAYRQAIQLDPQARTPRWNLANLLEYDAHGDHYASGKDLEEAIRLYQALSAEEKSEALDANLMRCLAFVGRYPEARAIAKSRLGAASWNDWYVAMTVCSLGLAEAMSDASQVFQSLETRRQAFLSAGDLLVHFRRYAEAGALLHEGAPASDQQTQTRARAEVFTTCRKGTQPAWPPKDPQSAALLFMLRLLGQQVPVQPMLSHVARAQRETWNEELASRFGTKIANLPSFRGFPRPVIADLVQSQTRFAVEGSDAKGYQVRFEMPGYQSVFLVAAEEATYRIVALFQDELGMARQAMALADQGDTRGASAWLDLAQETAYAGWPQDALSPSPIHRLRTKGSIQGAGELKVAAASLLAYDNPSDATLAILREAIAATKDKLPLQALRKAYAHGCLRRLNLKEAELTIGQLQVASPASYTVLQLRALLLLQAHRWEALLDLTQRVLALAPDDIAFTKFKWKALMHLGKRGEANDLLELSIRKGKLSNQDYNEFVLLHLELGLTGPDTLELARRVTKNPEDQTSNTLQTLAAVLAGLGRTSEARETLLLALTLTNKRTPRAEDWYVLGKIAERLGDRQAAVQCYSRVHRDPNQALWEKAFLVDLAKRHIDELQ